MDTTDSSRPDRLDADNVGFAPIVEFRIGLTLKSRGLVLPQASDPLACPVDPALCEALAFVVSPDGQAGWAIWAAGEVPWRSRNPWRRRLAAMNPVNPAVYGRRIDNPAYEEARKAVHAFVEYAGYPATSFGGWLGICDIAVARWSAGATPAVLAASYIGYYAHFVDDDCEWQSTFVSTAADLSWRWRTEPEGRRSLTAQIEAHLERWQGLARDRPFQ